MASRIILFILAYLTWILLTWPAEWQHMAAGVPIALFVAYIAGDLFIKRPHLLKDPKRYFWFCCYIPVFVWECLKANIDVAYRVCHPDLPISPGIVKVKTSLRSDMGLTFLANSITLTPGTMTVDIDKEQGYLYIHWIDVKSKDVQASSEIIVQQFESILRRVFE